jgi:hypothetical protein
VSFKINHAYFHHINVNSKVNSNGGEKIRMSKHKNTVPHKGGKVILHTHTHTHKTFKDSESLCRNSNVDLNKCNFCMVCTILCTRVSSSSRRIGIFKPIPVFIS